MSDPLPPSSPDEKHPNAPQGADVPAQTVPSSAAENAPAPGEAHFDPDAQAADRAGFKFLAIGFAIFFAIIAICASIVALVMKSMGI